MVSQPRSTPVGSSTRRVDWRTEFERALRALAAATVAGVVSGIVVGGIGGRLAMGLLAAKNPQQHGKLTDDEFVMGRFTLGGTVALLITTAFLGLLASLVYLALRGLLIGPFWFQVTSMAVGAGVVVGALLVDPEGVDFSALDPPLLPIALFIAIPVLSVAMLTALAQVFLRPDSWFATGNLRWVLALTAALWVIGLALVPVLAAVAVGWVGWVRIKGTGLATAVRAPATQWLARGLLSVVFGMSVVNLGSDIQALV